MGTRYFVVTDYAVGRLRERLEKRNRRALLAQDNEALKDLLDEAVVFGLEDNRVKTFDNADGKGVMVDVEAVLALPLWAFLRPDRTKSGMATGKQVVVTVMEHSLVDRLNACGDMGRFDEKKLQALADAENEVRLVSWKNGSPEYKTQRCLSKELPELLHSLALQGIQPTDVQVWKPVKTKTKLTVEEQDV
jgi:hypothetical protein